MRLNTKSEYWGTMYAYTIGTCGGTLALAVVLPDLSWWEVGLASVGALLFVDAAGTVARIGSE